MIAALLLSFAPACGSEVELEPKAVLSAALADKVCPEGRPCHHCTDARALVPLASDERYQSDWKLKRAVLHETSLKIVRIDAEKTSASATVLTAFGSATEDSPQYYLGNGTSQVLLEETQTVITAADLNQENFAEHVLGTRDAFFLTVQYCADVPRYAFDTEATVKLTLELGAL